MAFYSLDNILYCNTETVFFQYSPSSRPTSHLRCGQVEVMRGRDAGTSGCLLQSAGGEANRILLASALSSMRIICPNRVSWCDWIIAVSLGCFVSLRTSSFLTKWYHLMPSSICRHHWSSASILRASVLDTTQEYC